MSEYDVFEYSYEIHDGYLIRVQSIDDVIQNTLKIGKRLEDTIEVATLQSHCDKINLILEGRFNVAVIVDYPNNTSYLLALEILVGYHDFMIITSTPTGNYVSTILVRE